MRCVKETPTKYSHAVANNSITWLLNTKFNQLGLIYLCINRIFFFKYLFQIITIVTLLGTVGNLICVVLDTEVG